MLIKLPSTCVTQIFILMYRTFVLGATFPNCHLTSKLLVSTLSQEIFDLQSIGTYQISPVDFSVLLIIHPSTHPSIQALLRVLGKAFNMNQDTNYPTWPQISVAFKTDWFLSCPTCPCGPAAALLCDLDLLMEQPLSAPLLLFRAKEDKRARWSSLLALFKLPPGRDMWSLPKANHKATLEFNIAGGVYNSPLEMGRKFW